MAKKNGNERDEPSRQPPDQVRASGWEESGPKLKWRPFPGPKRVNEPIRLTVDSQAYADLVAHAKETIDTEVCGVLVGDTCEDEEGVFVSVDGVIRGTSVRQGGTHVTFTQETWNQIHEVKDKRFAKKQIVGWYHSHPGFGVEFSDMDLFIQRNFFAGRAQVALVTDPLGGQDAVCVNVDGGIKYVSRFWIDGRERRASMPAQANAPETAGATSTGGAPSSAALNAIEQRLSQVLQAVEEQRNSTSRTLFFLGVLVAMAVAMWVGLMMYNQFLAPPEPPKLSGVRWLPVPIDVNGEPTQVGVGVVEWKVPPALLSAYEKAIRQKVAEEQYARRLEEARAKAESEQSKDGEAKKPATTKPSN